MNSSKKILFVNFGGIGDEILFLPTILSLKKEFPDSSISLALEPRSKSIIDLTSVIDDVLLVDIKGKDKYFEIFKFILTARRKNFDIAISAGGNRFMSIILFLIGAKKRYGYYTGFLSDLLLTKSVKLNKNQYAVNMYHDLVKPLTNYVTELPEIDIEPQVKEINSVLIHPGVSLMSVKKGITKTIAPKIWVDVINLLLDNGKKVILAGGPDDEFCISEILKQVKQSELFENIYGKTKNLKELAIAIAKAEKFVCSDSAPLHIAVALKTKTYAIFGPTDDKKLVPEFVHTLKANDICPLKPCLWEKRQTSCDKLDCLRISAENIVQNILN